MGKTNPSTPAFELAYATWPIWPSVALTELVRMMTPRSAMTSCADLREGDGCCETISEATFEAMRNEPRRLIRCTSAKMSKLRGRM